MTGHLRSKGHRIGEKRVGKSLGRINPGAQSRRTETAGRSLNPKQYRADYFGQKLHVDQNEKLAMYGVTHVCARDGFSGLITSFSTMPVKNNLIIYTDVYRYEV